MTIAKRFFNFYIESSIHVAFEGVALVIITLYQFYLPVSFNLLAFIFFGIVTSYNFVKYAEFAGLHHRRLTASLKVIQIFSLICFCFLVYFTFQQTLESLMVFGFFGILTVLYAVPFLNKKNLRAFSSLKIFIVALVWAGITVFVPIVYNHANVHIDLWVIFAQRFLIIVVLMFPFDIRDLKYDGENLRTLPQILGIRNCKIIGTVLLAIIVILQFTISENNINSNISLVIFCFILFGLLWGSRKENGKYYAAFWVEAAAIFWVFILFALQYIKL